MTTEAPRKVKECQSAAGWGGLPSQYALGLAQFLGIVLSTGRAAAHFHATKPLPSAEVVMEEIDWTQCPDVESVPGRCSGAWVAKDSRILIEGIIDNYDAGMSPQEIGEEVFPGLGADRASRIIAFARSRVRQPAPHL